MGEVRKGPSAAFRIVVGTDFSEGSSMALERALAEAQRPNAELHVVSVIDDATTHLLEDKTKHENVKAACDKARELLRADVLAAMKRTSHQLSPLLHVRTGEVARQLVAFAKEIQADLVIVGSHGRHGLRAHLLGNVADRVSKSAPCPVTIVRSKDPQEPTTQIEPPCPDCVQTRQRTGGKEWWCADHADVPLVDDQYAYSERLDQPPTPQNDVL